jgi:small conductance mechanosensitive channel
METATDLSQKIFDFVMFYGPKLVGALITLAIGWWIIKIIQKALRKKFEKSEMEPSLRGFLTAL